VKPTERAAAARAAVRPVPTRRAAERVQARVLAEYGYPPYPPRHDLRFRQLLQVDNIIER
jgi:hypothetical protein